MANSKLSDRYGFVKPNDVRALNLMNAAAEHVFRVLPDVVLGYGYSDEYSFVFHKSCKLFERRSAKLASTIVSSFTSAYVHLWTSFFEAPSLRGTYFDRPSTGRVTDSKSDKGSSVADTQLEPLSTTSLHLNHLPTFDARCISYPSNQNLRDYISWRQADCHINNLYNTTFWALVLKGGMTNTEAEVFLKGSVSSDKNEILWSRFGINYNNEQEVFKKGSVIFRDYQLTEPEPDATLPRADLDESTQECAANIEPSKSQREKIKKAKQKARISVQHIDVIKDDFWLRRPWLLSGTVGRRVT